MCDEYEIPTEDRAKQLCDTDELRNETNWAGLTVKELIILYRFYEILKK